MAFLMLLTVVIPVYNGERFITDAINSILCQSFKDFELIIINDASTDDTVSIINKYKDNRIRLLHNDSNLGLARVRNKGLEYARGEYIAWLDADDISLQGRLEKQVRLLNENPEIGICGTWVQTFGSKQRDVWRYPTDADTIRCRMIFDNPLATSSVMIRKSLLVDNNLSFNIEFPPAEDYDLWERLSNITKIVNIPEILTHYRLHNTQTSFSSFGLEKQKKSVLEIQRRILEKLNLLPSEIELSIHEKIGVNWDFLCTEKELRNANLWLQRLFHANQGGKIFPQQAFIKVLSDRFWSICNNSYNLGHYLWNEYNGSPLRKRGAYFFVKNNRLRAKTFLYGKRK